MMDSKGILYPSMRKYGVNKTKALDVPHTSYEVVWYGMVRVVSPILGQKKAGYSVAATTTTITPTVLLVLLLGRLPTPT